jgi:acid phosphatase family membrane protein YuiD
VATAVALTQGLSSPLFAVCVAFSVIVMYDAMGVRRHAGKQAEVLNQVRLLRRFHSFLLPYCYGILVVSAR